MPVDDARGHYHGGGWAWGKTDYAANYRLAPSRIDYGALNPVVAARVACLKLTDIVDGASQTVLAGEKALSSDDYDTGSWYWDEPFFLGGSDSTARKGSRVLKDAPGTTREARHQWGSPHPAGAQFAFADGSVRVVTHGTDSVRLRGLLTPAGGEVVPEP